MNGNSRADLLGWRKHAHGSPLYAHLIDVTVANPDLMAVIAQITNLPPPNVYFAAIQYLLMDDPDQPLADYYRSLTDHPGPVEEVDPLFTEFVLDRSEEIVGLANSRYTQTNEARRCTSLLLGAMASPFDSFHLVDLGTSAGVNLAMDRFRYAYDGQMWGPEDSPVRLSAEIRGDRPRLRAIRVLSRTGIDLNVIDRNDPDDRRWLEALVWPEHTTRRDRLKAALQATMALEMNLVEGDILSELAPVLAGLPEGEPVVVINSFVLNQVTAEQRRQVADVIDEARANHPISRVSLEVVGRDDPWPRLQFGQEVEMEDLGLAHPHGEWVDLAYP